MDDYTQATSDFLKGGIDFEATMYEQGLMIRESAKAVYGPLLDARLTLMAVANELFQIKALVPGNTDQNISERLLLTTVFFQGTYAIETLISEGQYIKASSALKQDFELLARLGEIAVGAHSYGKTPNARYAPEGSQRYYGDLNSVAHIAKSDLLERLVSSHLDGGIAGVSPIPHFVPEVAKSLYELHVWMLLQMCRQKIMLYFDLYGGEAPEIGRALQWYRAATEILRKADWKIEDGAPSDADQVTGSAVGTEIRELDL